MVLQIGALCTTVLSRGQRVSIPNAVAMTSIVRTDSVPMRSSMSLTMPRHADVERLRRAIEQALELGDEDRVVMRRRSLRLDGDETLTCDVEVRAIRPIEESEVLAVAREGAGAALERRPVGVEPATAGRRSAAAGSRRTRG